MSRKLSGAHLLVEREREPRFFKLELERDRHSISRAGVGMVWSLL